MKDINIEHLWKKFEKDKNYKEQLIEYYLPLVRYVAGRLAGRCGKFFDYEDLVGFGIIGLIDAISKYDFRKNIKFETYATIRIKGAILDEMRNQDMFTRSQREKLHKLEDAYIKLENRLGRDVTEEEVAKELKISKEELNNMMEEVSPLTLLSLDANQSFSYNHLELLETIEDRRAVNPLEEIEIKEMKEILEKTINNLSAQERTVLALYYYEELTFKEITKVMEISEGRVSQIHTQAIVKLRSKLKNYLKEIRRGKDE